MIQMPFLYAQVCIRSMRLTVSRERLRNNFLYMQKTFVTYLLYQHSQYAAFDRPNKTDVMIITLGKIAYQGDVKISKTDEKVQWLDRDQRKLKKTNMAQ